MAEVTSQVQFSSADIAKNVPWLCIAMPDFALISTQSTAQQQVYKHLFVARLSAIKLTNDNIQAN